VPKALTTAMLVFAVTLAVAATAFAEGEPTRAEYVTSVDPICKKNVDSNKKLLKPVRKEVKNDQLKPAATAFEKVSKNFGRTITTIEAVPRPLEDAPRLEKWFKFLKIVQTNLSKVGKALREGNKVKATHEQIRAERSSNAANNVSFVFGFSYCALKPSQFQ
jgi:hypothetical protein